MNWPDVSTEFAEDGALRDVYVFGTTLADWQAVYDRLRQSPYRLVLGGGRPLPDDVGQVLAPRGDEDRGVKRSGAERLATKARVC